jgi:hypothetical protein
MDLRILRPLPTQGTQARSLLSDSFFPPPPRPLGNINLL